jgi:2',3'-cyclic-nucleotide 2'-phosphodiesterase (5'-nucleotidase family)
LAPRLRIIATNDFHGALEPRPDASGALRGGAAYVAGAIRAAEAECRAPQCTTILLDGGDEFQGTPASNLAYGRPVIDVFNYLGLSAAALGNHEFDWTQDTLRALMRAAHYPIMGANVRYADGRDVPWIPDDTIVHRGPITVGIIGISTVETPSSTMPANVTDLRFVDPVPIIDSIAPALRARGAEVVIVIAHAGGTCTAAGCQGEILSVVQRLTARVDVIVSGHSHTFINTVVKGTPVVQARSRGQAIDVVDLLVGVAPTVLSHEVREVYTDSIAPDPDVRDMTRAALDRVAPIVARPVATIAETMRNDGRQNALGNLIADAMRVVGHGDIGLMNNGGIRQSLPAGPANYGSLFEIQPFANTLVRVRVTGSDLRAFFTRALARGTPNFHVSGARIVYHAGGMPGIDSITVGGRSLDDATVYTVVQSNFTASGGDNLGFGSAALSADAIGITDLDALIAYLRSIAQPVHAPAEVRLILRP